MSVIKKVGILLKDHYALAETFSEKLIPWLEKKGCEVVTKDFSKVQLVLTLGGDGTFIRGVHLLKGAPIPILGIRLGHLGFLTQVSPDEFEPILSQILSQGPQVEKRIKVKAKVHRKDQGEFNFHALNDVVFHTNGIARIASFKITLNGIYFSTVQADGVLIATPTGSTAYSFAAGGPIIEPSHPLFVITPICPKNRTNGSLVVSDQSKIELMLEDERTSVALTIDGQEFFELRADDKIEIQKSEEMAYFVKAPQTHFFETVRKKLF
ncbi:MAG: NAD(+)/NADH kinase [Deltaproteobacteria bacterium]|nr:NAD(+)/NADH kinase [Deltaproteobacteria bacterium]